MGKGIEMTTTELQAAIRTAIEPLAKSVETLGGKFDDHRFEMVRDVTEIKTDIKYLKENQKNTDEWIDNLRDKTAFMRTEKASSMPYATKTTSSTSNQMIKLPVPMSFLGWLVAAILIGAALVGGLVFGGGFDGNTPTSAKEAPAAVPVPSMSSTAQKALEATRRAAEAAKEASESWSAPQESEQ
jgi:outer membrane murein-binding lipoprotein Lpp